MKNMILVNIALACEGTLVYPGAVHKPDDTEPAREAVCVVIDSRQVEENGVFIATRGERVDGHSFIGQVAAKGVLGVVCEQVPDFEEHAVPYILVKDSFTALKQIAAYYRSQLSIPIVGITGSVGKTSTKECVAGVLSQKYQVLKTAGNFNNEIGVPLTLLQIRPEHQAAVLEMGINHFGEMHSLSEMVKPDICVMTNIGQCHLEFLGSREGILRAKSEIFDFINPGGYVCVNGDDDLLETVGKITTHETCHFGLQTKNEIYATEIENKGLFGSVAKLHIKKEPDEAGISAGKVCEECEFTAQIPLPGEHMVYNALAATTVGRILGLTTEEIIRGISSVEAVGGRSHIIKTEHHTLIDDCYNANPVSMKAAIDLLKTALGRKVAVLGDMFELGENEKQLHAEIGEYAMKAGVDLLLCAGPLSKEMQAAHWFATREELEQALQDYLQDGDTILIKASHGMQFEKIVEKLVK